MTNIRKFVGIYERQNNILTTNDQKAFNLILSERQETTPKKPKEFLLSVDKKTKKRDYVSSIYPTAIKDLYLIEYKFKEYYLFRTESTCVIIEKGVLDD